MRIWKDVWDYAKMIIIVVLIVTLINNVVLINAKIPSESMEKTIMTGDRIFGFRLAYGLNLDFFGHEISKKIKDPERFDIIIFKYPDDEKKLFIKRLIGLPGEKVQITDGKFTSTTPKSHWPTASSLRKQEETSVHTKFLKTAISCSETTATTLKIPAVGKPPTL